MTIHLREFICPINCFVFINLDAQGTFLTEKDSVGELVYSPCLNTSPPQRSLPPYSDPAPDYFHNHRCRNQKRGTKLPNHLFLLVLLVSYSYLFVYYFASLLPEMYLSDMRLKDVSYTVSTSSRLFHITNSSVSF